MGRSAVAHSTPAAVASAVVPHPAQASGATGVAGGAPVGLSARVTPVPAPRTRTVSVLTAAARRRALTAAPEDRKSVGVGKRVDLGGRRIIKKKNKTTYRHLALLRYAT